LHHDFFSSRFLHHIYGLHFGWGCLKSRSLGIPRGLNLRNHCGFQLGNITVKHEMRRHCALEGIQLDGSPLVWPRCQFQTCLDCLSQNIAKGLKTGFTQRLQRWVMRFRACSGDDQLCR
jgi:hypothetical protein